MKAFFSKTFKKIGTFLSEKIPRFALVLYALALFCGLVHLLCLLFPAVADFVNIYPAGGVRFVLAKITGILPFSLGETLILLLPFLIAALVIFVSVQMKKEHYDLLTRFFAGAFAVLSLFYSTFVFTLAMGYHGSTLDEKLELHCRELTSDELLEVSQWLVDEVNECAQEVDFIYESSSVMPYGFEELNQKLNAAYRKAAEKYPFVMGYSSNIKPVMLSTVLSRAGLLGMYSYYTGECNVNVDYPDYNLVFTCAHEMSHQRGIARENEANFMAFLVCLESDDAYIRYCGYLNLFEYIRSPLAASLKKDDNSSAYSKLMAKLDRRAYVDIGVSQKKTSENQGILSEISEKINDNFIKRQGDEHGTASYGLVIELAAAYYFDRVANETGS